MTHTIVPECFTAHEFFPEHFHTKMRSQKGVSGV